MRFQFSTVAAWLIFAGIVCSAEPAYPELLRLHNEARAKAGVPPLVLSEADAVQARVQSEVQARQGGECQHSVAVMTRKVFDWTENVASKHSVPRGAQPSDYTQAEVHGDWMASPGHRGAILDKQWTHVGFGKATGRDGIYWTTVFRKGHAPVATVTFRKVTPVVAKEATAIDTAHVENLDTRLLAAERWGIRGGFHPASKPVAGIGQARLDNIDSRLTAMELFAVVGGYHAPAQPSAVANVANLETRLRGAEAFGGLHGFRPPVAPYKASAVAQVAATGTTTAPAGTITCTRMKADPNGVEIAGFAGKWSPDVVYTEPAPAWLASGDGKPPANSGVRGYTVTPCQNGNCPKQ